MRCRINASTAGGMPFRRKARQAGRSRSTRHGWRKHFAPASASGCSAGAVSPTARFGCRIQAHPMQNLCRYPKVLRSRGLLGRGIPEMRTGRRWKDRADHFILLGRACESGDISCVRRMLFHARLFRIIGVGATDRSFFAAWCDGGACAMSRTTSMFSAFPSSAPQTAASEPFVLQRSSRLACEVTGPVLKKALAPSRTNQQKYLQVIRSPLQHCS